MRVIGATSLRFPPRASAPTNPARGDSYFNTADGNLYVWDGAWQQLDFISSGGGGGAAAIKQVEVDFGAVAKRTAVFSIAEPAVNATTSVIAVQSGAAATGRSADENEMDAISFRVEPRAGSMKLYATPLDGPVAGLYRVDYVIG